MKTSGSRVGFLITGVTLAVLRVEGTLPVNIDELMILVIGSTRTSRHSFSIHVGRGSSVQDFVDEFIACVGSVPVGQKSFETIFRKLTARKLGQETEGTLARGTNLVPRAFLRRGVGGPGNEVEEDPLFLKNPFAHERGLLIGAAQSQ